MFTCPSMLRISPYSTVKSKSTTVCYFGGITFCKALLEVTQVHNHYSKIVLKKTDFRSYVFPSYNNITEGNC